MGSSCSTPGQPVPTTAAEAAEAFMCRAHLCRLSGEACARRYRREEAKRKSRRDIGCDGCEAGKARAELLGIEPPSRVEKSIPLPEVRHSWAGSAEGAEANAGRAAPPVRHCEACGTQLDPRRLANRRNPLDTFCRACVEAAAAPVRAEVLGAPRWLIAQVVRGERAAESVVREALRLGCMARPVVRGDAQGVG